MGVLSERVFAVLLAMPWRSRAGSEVSEGRTEGTLRELHAPAPTRPAGWKQIPSSSALRADLEAVRAYARVK